MNTPLRLLGVTLGATAIVGSSAVAANACDLGGHAGSAGAFSSAQQFLSGTVDRIDEQSGDRSGDWSAGRGVSFAQEQAALVQRLTDADSTLTDLIGQASAAAPDDPTGQAASQLSDLQAKQAELESLIDQVKAAGSPQQLAAAFRDAAQDATRGAEQSGSIGDESGTDATSFIPTVPAT